MKTGAAELGKPVPLCDRFARYTSTLSGGANSIHTQRMGSTLILSQLQTVLSFANRATQTVCDLLDSRNNLSRLAQDVSYATFPLGS